MGERQLLRINKAAAAQAPLNLTRAKALLALGDAATRGPVAASLIQQAIEAGVPKAIAETAAKTAQIGVVNDLQR